jgi:hypothetical protein
VPAVFTYVDDLEHLIKRFMARMRKQKPPVKQVAQPTL